MRTETSFAQSRKSLDLRRGIAAMLLAGVLLCGMAGEAHAQLFTRGNQVLTTGPDQFHCGEVVATADFNNDGFTDLAVGVRGATVGGLINAGEIQVWYGSASGFAEPPDEFHQGALGVPDVPEENDVFGSSLEAGDFDSDGYADLAIGVRGEDILAGATAVSNAGVVDVLYGSSDGLTGLNSQQWSQESPGINDTAEDDDNFGGGLAAGDFDHDGFTDLAIGAPWEDIGVQTDAGKIWILFGSASGLTAAGSLAFDEAAAGSAAIHNNLFGFVLTAGDFDDDGFADLAAGVSHEPVVGHPNAGAVWIFPGTASGPTIPGTVLYQGAILPSGTVAGLPEDNDGFGSSLAVGDFNRANSASPRYQELAIGVTGENASQGAVEILFGSASGISAAGSYLIRESDLPDPPASPFNFGMALAAGGLHSTVRSDLVVAAPFEDVGGITSAGRVFVIPGSASGLVLGLAAAFDSATPGLATGPPTENEELGYVLALGNFDGRGARDLALGAPGFSPMPAGPLGGFEILYSALFAADFETQNFSQWSSVTP